MIKMAGYWIPVNDTERVYTNTLRDAYRDAAAVLIGLYKRAGRDEHKIHRLNKWYNSSDGLPIFDTRTGKSTNHWVRFYESWKPEHGYEEVSYGKAYGIASKAKEWPKNWL